MSPRLTRLLQVVWAFSAVVAGSRGFAQTVVTTWSPTVQGSGIYLWGASGNWTFGVPSGGNDAQFNSGSYSSNSPTIATGAVAASVTVNYGAQNLSFNPSSGGSLTLTSAFNQNAGAGSLYAVTEGVDLNLSSGFNFQTNTAGAVLELTGTTTSTGPVNVTNGIELLLSGAVSGIQSFNVSNGADLKFIRSDTFAMNIVNNSSVTFSDGSGYTSNYTGSMSGTGKVTINDPTVFTSTGNTYSGNTYLNNSLQDDGNANAFSPSSAMVLSAAGSLQMDANETIAGYTDTGSSSIHINSSTLTINGPGFLTGNVYADGGAITLNPGTGQVFSLYGTSGFGNAQVTLTSGKLELQPNSDAADSNITNTSGVLVFDQNATQPTTHGVVNNHELDVNAGTLDSYVSGTGNVFLNGVGAGSTVTVNGSQTYTGGTYIPTGVTVQDGVNSAFSATSIVYLTGTGALNVQYNEAVSAISGLATTQVMLASGATLYLTGAPNIPSFDGIISGAGGLGINGGASATFTGANTYTGGTTIAGTLSVFNTSGSGTGYFFNAANAPSITINSGGILFVGGNSASGAVDGTIDIQSGGQLHFGRTDNTTVSNNLTGAGSVYFQGSGTTTITGKNDYTGYTQQNSAGHVILSNASLGTGGMDNYGILSGAGSVSTSNYLSSWGGSKLSPVLNGTPSTISIGSAYFYQNSTFEVSMTSATGTAGTNWSLLSASGSLDFSAIPYGSTMTIKLTSLNGGAAGLITNFNPYQSYTWDIMTNNGITYGFYPSTFTIDSSGFLNDTMGGAFSIGLDGSAIALDFTPVPEPGTWALMLAGAGMAGFALWRRRQSA